MTYTYEKRIQFVSAPRYAVQTRNAGEGWKTADQTNSHHRAEISAMSYTNSRDEVRIFDRDTNSREWYKRREI